jgi:cell wall-associated NlpC family hydrolase
MDGAPALRTIATMPPLRTCVLGFGLLAAACATRTPATRREPLPPPATATRAGTRDPGAGPDSAPARPTGALETARPAPAPVQARRPPAAHDAAVRRAVETASSLVGQREIVVRGVRWGDGCAALVRAAFAEAGSPLPARALDAHAIQAYARERGAIRRSRPAPGDLVFLADRPGGPAEHVGLVESVGADGTALVLHRTDQGVLRVRVNSAQPWKLKADTGRRVNDLLVVGGGRVAAGRLLVAYATVL